MGNSTIGRKPFSPPDPVKLARDVKHGLVSADQVRVMRREVASASPSRFGGWVGQSKLLEALKKIEEGAISIPMMAFGWTRELIEGTASVIRGRGTISGPVSAQLKALNKTGVSPASLVSLDARPQSPAADRQRVYEAQKKAVNDIGGYDFLSQPPKGKTANEHVLLIKPGVNWGALGYPTATSGESTYGSVRHSLEEARARGAKLRVIVGDESGIENKAWGGTTMGNFEHVGVLDGAVRAGLEEAALRESKGEPAFAGAKALLERLGPDRKVTRKDAELIAMAKKAGVEVVAFEGLPAVRVPVPDIKPGMPGNKHFPDGVLIPKVVAEEVTDIINLPKPPGRHALMGCAGLTGALKNHIGLLAGSDRVPMLHGPLDRVPGLSTGAHGPKWADQFKEWGEKLKDPSLSREDRIAYLRKLQGNTKWDLNNEHGPNMMLHEKIAELSSVFADKERFTVVDMRQTLSSIGPDVGDTVDVGKVIASKHAATVDVIANGLMKSAYAQMGRPNGEGRPQETPQWLQKAGEWFEVARPGGDTPLEYFYGQTWLEKGATAFDTLQIRAAMAYGLTPLGKEMIDLKTHLAPGENAGKLLETVKTPS